jgi:hypothetical protein
VHQSVTRRSSRVAGRSAPPRMLRATLLLAAALLLLGTLGCGPTNGGDRPTLTTTTTVDAAVAAPWLVGTWNTISRGTDWVDDLTYQFRADGTYLLTAKKMGTTTGTQIQTGDYRVEDERILLSECRETWIDATGATEYRDKAVGDNSVWYESVDGVLTLNGEAYQRIGE